MRDGPSAIAPTVDPLSRIDRKREIQHVAQRERRGGPEGATLRNVGRDPGAQAPAVDRDVPCSATAVDVAMVAAVAEAARSEAAILISRGCRTRSRPSVVLLVVQDHIVMGDLLPGPVPATRSPCDGKMVGRDGIEPPTPGFSVPLLRALRRPCSQSLAPSSPSGRRCGKSRPAEGCRAV